MMDAVDEDDFDALGTNAQALLISELATLDSSAIVLKSWVFLQMPLKRSETTSSTRSRTKMIDCKN